MEAAAGATKVRQGGYTSTWPFERHVGGRIYASGLEYRDAIAHRRAFLLQIPVTECLIASASGICWICKAIAVSIGAASRQIDGPLAYCDSRQKAAPLPKYPCLCRVYAGRAPTNTWLCPHRLSRNT
jgi:hypothetical protein